jgi:tetratricopeptide (TPR) repeat protein
VGRSRDAEGGRPGASQGRAPGRRDGGYQAGDDRPRGRGQERDGDFGSGGTDGWRGARQEHRAPGLAVADDITADQLDREARAELRTLPGQLADAVARLLVAASQEPDAERAYEYSLQARRLAARVGVVRETSGVAAYRAGRWAEALAELRTARRLTGRASYLPLMADSERALGRLDRALAIVHDPDAGGLDRATQIELLIVESGIRRDEGRPAAAAAVLQVPELTDGRRRPWSARLFYAYADALLDDGREDEAREWFGRAAALDPEGETDAGERYEELDSVVIDDLAEPDAEEDGGEDAGEDAAEDNLDEEDAQPADLDEA